MKSIHLPENSVVLVTAGGRGVTSWCVQELSHYQHLHFVLIGRTVLEKEPEYCKNAQTPVILKKAIFDNAKAQNMTLSPKALEQQVGMILGNREILQTIKSLKDNGSSATYYSLDVRDSGAVKKLVDEIVEKQGSIRGLIHGAGLIQDKLIAQKTKEQFQQVFDTKVKALSVLLDALEAQPLQLICLFSSIVATKGNPGQCDYAMANQILNNVATSEQKKRGDNCLVKSINWGAWEGGMVNPALMKQFQQLKVKMLSRTIGSELFVAELHQPKPTPVILGFDLDSSLEQEKTKLTIMKPSTDESNEVFTITPTRHSFLLSHCIKGMPVVPVCLAFEWFARSIRNKYPGLKAITYNDLKVVHGIRLENLQEKNFSVTLKPKLIDHQHEIQLALKSNEGAPLSYSMTAHVDLNQIPTNKPLSITLEDHHTSWPWKIESCYGDPTKLFHGPAFRLIQSLDAYGDQTASATINGIYDLNWPAQEWVTDPGIVDGAFQVASLFGQKFFGRISLPMKVKEIQIYQYGLIKGLIQCVFQLISRDNYRAIYNMVLMHQDGQSIMEIKGLEMVAIPSNPAPINAEKMHLASLPLNREQLIIHASGKVSSIFGSQFQELDHYKKRLRLPIPPFMFVDRVISISGEPASQGEGSISTETDLNKDTWYLHEGRMPLSIMLEAAQGHILLLSWLGWDFYHQGDKVYRLLGGTFKVVGEIPVTGDTVHYQIRIQKPIKGIDNLILFECDCYVDGELRLIMRYVKVGFFGDKELLSSSGAMWNPENVKCSSNTSLPSLPVNCQKTQFSKQNIEDFSKGNLFACFGQGFEFAQTHTHSPRIPSGRMQMIDEITVFDPFGGPWKRGYIRSIQNISPEDWFFKCHFINDPIMPGSLSFEAFIQTMAFYLAALGYTLDKDGWRFEVVKDVDYTFLPRGQILPSTKGVIYEVFVEEVAEAPYPTLIATVMATTFEGTKITKSRLGLQLVPDNPLNRHPELLPKEHLKPAAVTEGITLDYRSLLSFALGKPSEVFGERYKAFDHGKMMPRTPAPPFQFMSRIIKVQGERGGFKVGGEAQIEYDIPSDGWYFKENESVVMPFSVLIEAILQSAGWLSIFIGSVLQTQDELAIRNLNGTSKIVKALYPNSGTIRTEVVVKNISSAGNMIIETFDLKCFLKNEIVCETTSTFGFFTKKALEQQAGLPTTDAQNAILQLPSAIYQDFKDYPDGYKKGRGKLGRERLKMLDRITGFWKDKGAFGLGLLRAEKDINPSDWFFKPHFYRDPVQPGSLGLEAMIQLLEFYLLEQSGWEQFVDPVFEAPALGSTINWKYRGQVLPKHRLIIFTMEITSFKRTETDLLASAQTSLWVEGKRIYEADYSVRLYDKSVYKG